MSNPKKDIVPMKQSSCGKKQKPQMKGLQGMSVQELKIKIKLLYPYLTNVNTMKRQELCDLLSKDCPRLGGLVNKTNSCYLDSVLIGLFHTINPYIKKLLFDKKLNYDDNELQENAIKIQKMLRGVYSAISKGNKGACSLLRQSMQKFDKRYSRIVAGVEHLDWKTSQLEPGDVIKMLIRVFDIPDDCEYILKNYTLINKKKVLVNEEKYKATFADPNITPDMLYEKKHLDLRKFIPEEVSKVEFDDMNKWKPRPGVEYKHKITHKTYTKAPMLSVHISRVFGDIKLKTPIIPPLTIKLKENKQPLHLRSILVHHGDSPEYGHYICYIRCQKYWYKYDDLGFEKLEFIGTNMKLFKMNNFYVLKNAVDLIYW